jgi:hypothetical protein
VEKDGKTPRSRTVADRAVEAFALVEGWLFSQPMADLLDAFGERLPTVDAPSVSSAHDNADWLHLNEELPEWLDKALSEPRSDAGGLSPESADLLRRTLAVERMAAADFNFRAAGDDRYKERSQAAVADFDAALRDRVLELTDRLGLVSPAPTRSRRYEKTLVLGGGYRSPLLRARYAAQLQADGIDLGELSFLGSPRFMIEEPAERPVVEEYAPGANDEFDLMVGAARAAFGLVPASVEFLCGCSSTDVVCPSWRHGRSAGAEDTPPAYTHERRVGLLDEAGQTVGSAFSASTGRPPYRPDTSDTFGLWARCSEPQPGQAILVVTTQVFVPFQMFDGIRRLYLPFGSDVDTVGFGAEWGDRPQTAEYLLQETLSAIRSARRLLVDAAEALTRPVWAA